jgi:hypothetical protein
MKNWKLTKLKPVNWLLLLALLQGALWFGKPQTTARAQDWPVLTVQPAFVIRSYGGKCLDFGPPPHVSGAPVFINDCNGSSAQQVRIEEINARHDVILRAGNKVIGVKLASVNTNALVGATQTTAQTTTETPLQLQDELNRTTFHAQGQIFALDGDSIMLASDHNRVVKVQNNRGANRTPLVLGQRELADHEFFTFTDVNGSGRRPTSGFVRVPQEKDFVTAVREALPGTVIEVEETDDPIDLTGLPALFVPGGVTIRGDRRGTHLGPELKSSCSPDGAMFDLRFGEVRITGLRLSGPSRSTDTDVCEANGIAVYDQLSRAVIDHNDLSGWTIAAVKVAARPEGDNRIHCTPLDRSRPSNVRIVRNFIHHNQKQGEGYGVASNSGAFPLIEGNTFVANRHAIKGGAEVHTGYRAQYNLVLATAPVQDRIEIIRWHTQDFDVHGSGDNGFGYRAGDFFEITRNTFLGTDRQNFDLRGEPCNLVDFHHNISLQAEDDAIGCTDCGAGSNKLSVHDNQFTSSNPTNKLGTGDFDGDGKEDLFLATGAAWYYAPSGNAEWRLLNAQTDKIGTLLFGDFDSDGRTDVFTQHGYNWEVSWGGASRWETINVSGNILGNAAVGDFIGDERADVFYTDGQHWYFSDGGVSQFMLLNDSSFRVAHVRFGDFNADGKTDVFSVVSGQWMVSYGGTSAWQRLREKLSDSVARLIVADFNGDGRADVATSSSSLLGGYIWKVSYSGTGNWTLLREAADPLPAAAIGRFDGNASADVLLWHDYYLDISARGTGTPVRQSRQDMR